MFKLLFYAAVLGGLGYAAVTVPYHGRTMASRAWYYVEHDTDFQRAVGRYDSAPGSPAKRKPVVASRARPPAEHLTQADRDALDRLIPR